MNFFTKVLSDICKRRSAERKEMVVIMPMSITPKFVTKSYPCALPLNNIN
jgi:hypothetical protein